MATSITHTQTRTVQPGPLYRVADVVTAAVTIAPTVFVFSTDDAEFSRVASVADMSDYPEGQAAAQTAELGFYRVAEVTKDWSTLDDATDFAATLKSNLKKLAVDYEAATNGFIGTETLTVSS